MLKKEYKIAKEVLDNSRIIAFPTETVMGLGVYFNDYKAYKFLNKVKERPEDKPYTLMLSSIDEISKYAYVDERTEKIINRFMPGEITVLLKSKEIVPSYVTHNTGVIGIRVPNHKLLLDFLSYLKTPLLVPSANKSGNKPAMTIEEVKEIFHDDVGFVFNGQALGGVPSTLVDLTNKEVKIYREGNIKASDILSALKEWCLC